VRKIKEYEGMMNKEDKLNNPFAAKVEELYLQLNSFSSFSSSEKRELESLRNQKSRLEIALSNTTVKSFLIFYLYEFRMDSI